MNRRDLTSLTVNIPQSLALEVTALAESMQLTPDLIAEQALALWIAREEEIHKLTLEALEDVDAGRVISHADMKAWVDSLGTDKTVPTPQA